MDGTCVEMPDQRKPGETEGDPLVLTFNSEVLRIQQVRSGGAPMGSGAEGGYDAWRRARLCVVLRRGQQQASCSAPPAHGLLHPVRAHGASLRVLPRPALPQVMSSAVQVHQDITKCGQRVTRHLDAWRRYSDIWKTDKAVLLDKFKAKGPPCSAYEEKFSKFKKVRRGFCMGRGARGGGERVRHLTRRLRCAEPGCCCC